MIRSLLWDIALNAAIPAALFFSAKHFISPSELTALFWAASFPLLKSAYDLTKRRELNPVALLILLGLVASVIAVLFGEDPQLLLIRESFLTGAFGLACLISLILPRPIMFYFGRHLMAGRDPQRRDTFNARLARPYCATGAPARDGRMGARIRGRVRSSDRLSLQSSCSGGSGYLSILNRARHGRHSRLDVLVRTQGSEPDRRRCQDGRSLTCA